MDAQDGVGEKVPKSIRGLRGRKESGVREDGRREGRWDEGVSLVLPPLQAQNPLYIHIQHVHHPLTGLAVSRLRKRRLINNIAHFGCGLAPAMSLRYN